jgi:hypothetical protein
VTVGGLLALEGGPGLWGGGSPAADFQEVDGMPFTMIDQRNADDFVAPGPLVPHDVPAPPPNADPPDRDRRSGQVSP